MKPEILAKILRIIARNTGERVIVLDELTGQPFVILGLEDYEKLQQVSNLSNLREKTTMFEEAKEDLTQNQPFGMMNPDSADWPGVKPPQSSGTEEWGGGEDADEDRYYMEPAE